ncbi:hypothetical protein DW322_02400 [Rhodococcus rhodnii]|uniref:Uncharacterized protein n=2 Tax=Rhodococcus rhodnii TaxID=38312 RepID=R7WHZ8_9NOCA|nr:hypothetical protein [Rhodococcus rhodnii]EOM74788.1 hypothetical protein Rrhod_3868 [Rhodococcus rhodnii LMG 5362]TXG89298.1 hypothetical protein DW322_02400 [Rhodococcus rhodnii]
MADSASDGPSERDELRRRVREKLLRQRDEDDRTGQSVDGTDQRMADVEIDLARLDEADEADPVIDELARKYWVP